MLQSFFWKRSSPLYYSNRNYCITVSMVSGSGISNIAQMREEKDVEGLVEALRHGNRFVRENAANALGDISDVAAVDPLIKALEHGNEYVRENAAEALGKIGDIRAVDPLIQALLTDSHKDVRWFAAIALGKIGDIRAVEPLRWALNDDCDCVRMAATEALKRILHPLKSRT
jgi:HEAT repeat protein